MVALLAQLLLAVDVYGWAPVQLAFADHALQDEQQAIYGLRLNLGNADNAELYGLDFGLLNHTEGMEAGLQLALVMNTTDTFVGLQLALGVNLDNEAWGLQLALANLASRGRGLAVALTNVEFGPDDQGSLVGLAAGAFNLAGSVYGAQVGVFNVAREVSGLQVGLVNLAWTLHGVQLGLANVVVESRLPFFPVINVGL